jgi:hypothetical protein
VRIRSVGIVGLVLPGLALLACSDTAATRQEANFARYRAYASAPVERIAYLGRYDHWGPLSDTDLLLWKTPQEPYWIEVFTPCAKLTFASGRLELESFSTGTIQAGLDFIRIDGWRCQIRQIRPIDYPRMQADSRNRVPQPQNAAPEKSAN